MVSKTAASPAIALADLPLEIFRLILDKLYEGPQSLTLTKFYHFTTKPTTSALSITPLAVNRDIYEESLNAIHRSINNAIVLKLNATLSDLDVLRSSPTLVSFLPTVTSLTLVNFPYDSTILRSWKETCPNLESVSIPHIYSPTTNPQVHSTLMTPSYTSLLRGDADSTFADAAITRILAVHSKFHLAYIPTGLSLTFPNVIDFWFPCWEQEYYHENRVLILTLTITNTNTYVSGRSFMNRVRNVPYEPQASSRELPRFPGVDYEVKYVNEGNVKEPDYDYGKDCFRTPYS